MIIKLTYKGVEYDLSPYVDIKDNARQDTIEDQLDSGKIVLSRVPADAFVGLDMTRRLPSLCSLFYDNERGTQRYYWTADAQCFEVIRNRRWKHEIGLIELSKELQLTPIRDMTITQPQDGNYYSASSARTLLEMNNIKTTIFSNSSTWLEISDSGENPFTNGVYNIGVNSANNISTSLQEITFDTLDETNPSIIDGNVFKESGDFVINIKLNVINPNFNVYYKETKPIGWPFPDDKYEVWATQSVTPSYNLYYKINDGTAVLIGNVNVSDVPIVNNTDIDIPSFGTNSNVSFDIITQEQTNEFLLPISVNADDEIKFFINSSLGDFKVRKKITQLFSTTNYERTYSQKLFLSNSNVVLYKESDAQLEDPELPIRLGQTVEKIIRLSGLNLVISESTLARLNTYGTPENTFTRFTAWDALKEIGAIVGALPEIIINDDGDKELTFFYYADMENDFAVVEPPNVQSLANARSIENYVGGLRLNADNIVSSNLVETSPYNRDYEANTGDVEIVTDWMTLRAGSDGNVKISTDNIGIRLPNKIYQIRQVEIKGIDLNTMTSGVLPYNSEYIWKLNEEEDQLRILEEKYWQTLDDANDYTILSTRILTKKNNTIYYKQGDYRIYGMEFTAQYKPVWDIDPGETAGYRSIYELIFVKAIIDAGINQTQLDSILSVLKDPGTVAYDNGIKIRVSYVPQDLTQATIYKEDLSGFESPKIEKYFNETAIVNDPLSLGANAQDTINRLGNTMHTVIGYAKDGEQLPYIGTKTSDNKILTSITYVDRPFRTEYVANYVQDFSLINDYVGIKSPHRQYQIPSDGVVLAVDKNKTHVFVDSESFTSSSSVWGSNIKEFFDLKTTKSKAPLFAEISTYLFNTDYEDDVENGLFIRPLTKIPTGNTISFKYQMESNFSAGATKKKTAVDGQDIYWQEEVPYTTKFGRLYGSKIRLVKDVNKSAISSTPSVEDKYPILDENVVTDVYTTNKYIVDKDAREIMALSEEVSFHSNKVNEIIIYDGIAKFNPMTLTDVSRNNIKIAIIGNDYKVSKSAKKVDYTNLQTSGGTILNGITYTLYDNRIEFDIPAEASGKGLVIYNDDVSSGDLVLIYLTEISGAGTKTIYFGTKELGE